MAEGFKAQEKEKFLIEPNATYCNDIQIKAQKINFNISFFLFRQASCEYGKKGNS